MDWKTRPVDYYHLDPRCAWALTRAQIAYDRVNHGKLEILPDGSDISWWPRAVELKCYPDRDHLFLEQLIYYRDHPEACDELQQYFDAWDAFQDLQRIGERTIDQRFQHMLAGIRNRPVL